MYSATTYGDGSIYIFLSSAINEPGCQPNATRIDVQSTDPQIKQILAIAMMALATGKQITGAVNGCDPATGTPTFDTSTDSYIYVDQ